MLIEMPRFSVGKLLLHHYKSDLAHISDFDSLVIGLSKSERRANNNNKTKDYEICTLLSSLCQKMYGPNVLNILPFRFFGSFFFRDFLMIPYELFLYYLVKKESVYLRLLSCSNPYFLS